MHNIQQYDYNNFYNRMHIEQPYKPLTFVLTETIGLPFSSITDSSALDAGSLKYTDILVPKSIGSANSMYLYYMFHIAPIYNYIRNINIVGNEHGCREKQILQQYIVGGDKANTGISMTAPMRLQPSQFVINSLLNLCHRYEMVKKCISAKIRILKQLPHSQCNHYIKLSLYSHCYQLDISDSNKNKNSNARGVLKIGRYYCKQCQKWVDLSMSDSKKGNKQKQKYYNIEQYPLAPILDKYHGTEITIQSQSSQSQVYKLVQVYTQYYLLVMAANGIWYISRYTQSIGNKSASTNVEMGDMKICTNFYELIGNLNDKKWNGLCVYASQDMMQGCGLLRPAVPMVLPNNSSVHQQNKTKMNTLQQNMLRKAQRQQQKQQKQAKKIKQSAPITPTIQTIAQQLQPLIPHQPAPIASFPQNMPPSQKQQYIQQLQKLYPKQKQKDDYEKDYDKGKTKKIKKKVQYIKPNFNQIFKQVKKENEELISGRKEVERGNKNRKNRNRDGDRDGKGHGDGQGDRGTDRGRGRGGARGRGGHGRGGKFGHGFKGGNKFGKGKFVNHKQNRQRQKQQKQQFLKKFQAS